MENFIKKNRFIIIIVLILAFTLAFVIPFVTYIKNFPFKLGSKNKYIKTWRDILLIKGGEKYNSYILYDGDRPNEFTEIVQDATEEFYGVSEVSRKLFEQEQKKMKNKLIK